jgi:hypothetical protein
MDRIYNFSHFQFLVVDLSRNFFKSNFLGVEKVWQSHIFACTSFFEQLLYQRILNITEENGKLSCSPKSPQRLGLTAENLSSVPKS